ncbi:hypothetical protein BC826DRAFT_410335 [Russula brevipes]|nr:hypothetical protein BC826DRAFT_410335 [Russula brevipes]
MCRPRLVQLYTELGSARCATTFRTREISCPRASLARVPRACNGSVLRRRFFKWKFHAATGASKRPTSGAPCHSSRTTEFSDPETQKKKDGEEMMGAQVSIHPSMRGLLCYAPQSQLRPRNPQKRWRWDWHLAEVRLLFDYPVWPPRRPLRQRISCGRS